MKKDWFFLFLFLSCSALLTAQYRFSAEKKLPSSSVKNQQKTGTCWSFATASMLESELLKATGMNFDLSEMYIVRKIYEDKAQNYILRQGNASFGQGSLSHDLMNVVKHHGLMPEEAYTGKPIGTQVHNHSELEKALKGYLDGILKSKNSSNNWRKGVSNILDVYLGEVPETFQYLGAEYTARSFADSLEITSSDYISLSSFSHHPYYEQFILEIPDNYSNGSYYNLPLDEFVSIIDYALIEGYTITWDGDVSENTFSWKNGIAILPENPQRTDLYEDPGKEIEVTQESRQLNFENFKTTDDHLMHIIGLSLDQKGNKYYIVKNSWGTNNPEKGYIYMSEAYLKMKTIAVTVNKSGLPQKSAEKLLSFVD